MGFEGRAIVKDNIYRQGTPPIDERGSVLWVDTSVAGNPIKKYDPSTDTWNRDTPANSQNTQVSGGWSDRYSKSVSPGTSEKTARFRPEAVSQSYVDSITLHCGGGAEGYSFEFGYETSSGTDSYFDSSVPENTTTTYNINAQKVDGAFINYTETDGLDNAESVTLWVEFHLVSVAPHNHGVLN